MFDTTKDLRRVIIDTQQREKLVNNYRYRRQHNGADIQSDRDWETLFSP